MEPLVTPLNATTHIFSYTMTCPPTVSASGADIIATTSGVTQSGSISRVTAIMDHAGTSGGISIESYVYLWLDTIVAINRPEDVTELTYITLGSALTSATESGSTVTLIRSDYAEIERCLSVGAGPFSKRPQSEPSVDVANVAHSWRPRSSI